METINEVADSPTPEIELVAEATGPDYGPLDVIGTLFSAPVEEEAPTALPGWHVNSPWSVASFAAYQVTPATPRRVFAGVPTVFYTFPSEAVFLETLASADLSEPAVVQVPAAVTMRQARLALLAAGKLASVTAAINALPSPQKEAAQIEWEYSQEVQRHNGFVSLLAPVLGMTAADLDTLFIAAAGV